MSRCPECNITIYEYYDGDWLEWICWGCGYYESNTPAFRSMPYSFKDLVRNNPRAFLKKYANYSKRLSDDIRQTNKDDESDVNDTEPF